MTLKEFINLYRQDPAIARLSLTSDDKFPAVLIARNIPETMTWFDWTDTELYNFIRIRPDMIDLLPRKISNATWTFILRAHPHLAEYYDPSDPDNFDLMTCHTIKRLMQRQPELDYLFDWVNYPEKEWDDLLKYQPLMIRNKK
jgi:hypothetical protein